MREHYVADRDAGSWHIDRRPSRLTGALVFVLLVLIVGGAGLLRVWRITSLFHFMGDEGTQTLAEWRLIHGNLPLLGPSLSIGAMHLGPVFYYLSAIPLAMTGGSPVGPTILVSAFGIAAVALLYVYMAPAVGRFPALGAAAAMGTSFLMVEYSRRPWNPTPTPFFALLFLISLMAWKRRSGGWIIVVSASLAILLQLQPVNLFFVPLLVVFILAARPPWPAFEAVMLAIIVFVMIFFPLILYDATHHLANLHAWLDLFRHGKSTAPVRHTLSVRLLFNMFYRAYGVTVLGAALVLIAATVIALVVVSLTSNVEGGANWELLLPLGLLVIAAIGFQVYHRLVFEQYMVCLFVVPFIALGALLRLLSRHLVGVAAGFALVLALLAVEVRQDRQYIFQSPHMSVADASVTRAYLQPDDTYAHVRTVDNEILTWAHGRPFNLTMASDMNTDAAYRYLLIHAGHAPQHVALTYLLVEPATWSSKYWPPRARALAAHADREKRIGLVRLYEIPPPPRPKIVQHHHRRARRVRHAHTPRRSQRR